MKTNVFFQHTKINREKDRENRPKNYTPSTQCDVYDVYSKVLLKSSPTHCMHIVA